MYRTKKVGLVIAILAICSFSQLVWSQCVPTWVPGIMAPGVQGQGTTGTVTVLAPWQPAGDSQTYLIVGGAFTTDGVPTRSIASWNGRSWGAFSAGLPTLPLAITDFDEDGSGPQPTAIIAGGSFTTVSGVTVNRVTRWNGSSWAALGAGVNSDVRALVDWDFDGDPATASSLIAGGNFTLSGAAPAVSRVAKWNGVSWEALGTGVNAPVRALIQWDSDGLGPLPPQLIVAGEFSMAGGQAANRIAAWNGSSWLPLGSGTSGPVTGLSLWDRDGEGPGSPLLVAVGTFTTAGGQPANSIALWDGHAWEGIPGSPSFVNSACAWAPPNTGNDPQLLVVGGSFTSVGAVPARSIAAWNGTSWEPLGAGVAGTVSSIKAWDEDGPGGEPPSLAVGGQFELAGGTIVDSLAFWNGSQWRATSDGFTGEIALSTMWDADGIGPAIPKLVMGGHQEVLSSGSLGRQISAWDGHQWTRLGSFSWSGSRVTALGTGMGGATTPGYNNLIFAVQYPGQSAELRAFTGTAWSAFGGPIEGNDQVNAIRQLGNELYIGGDFTVFDTSPSCNINMSRWTGSNWTCVSYPRLVYSPVNVLITHNPDGSGGAPLGLYMGGSMQSVGTFPNSLIINYIARLNAGSWQALGAGRSGPVQALCEWDPDGEGPTPKVLVAGGSSVGVYQNSTWTDISPSNGPVLALASWDPDGSGPLPDVVVAAGSFTTIGGVPAARVAFWNGTSWNPISTGVNDSVRSLQVWDPDGTGPLPSLLAVMGRFGTAGGMPSGRFAWIRPSMAPPLAGQPESISVACPARSFEMRVETAVGFEDSVYQWQHATGDGSWSSLVDGSISQFGNVQGSDGRTLAVTDAGGRCAGDYRCIVSNTCGTTMSLTATVSFSCCAADLDNDGEFDNGATRDNAVTIEDLLFFLTGFEGRDIVVDLDNGSGTGVPDQAVTIDDLLFLLTHFEAGC